MYVTICQRAGQFNPDLKNGQSGSGKKRQKLQEWQKVPKIPTF